MDGTAEVVGRCEIDGARERDGAWDIVGSREIVGEGVGSLRKITISVNGFTSMRDS